MLQATLVTGPQKIFCQKKFHQKEGKKIKKKKNCRLELD